MGLGVVIRGQDGCVMKIGGCWRRDLEDGVQESRMETGIYVFFHSEAN